MLAEMLAAGSGSGDVVTTGIFEGGSSPSFDCGINNPDLVYCVDARSLNSHNDAWLMVYQNGNFIPEDVEINMMFYANTQNNNKYVDTITVNGSTVNLGRNFAVGGNGRYLAYKHA